MTPTSDNESKIDAVVQLLLESKSLLIITGAGLSADSGLPTLRGEESLSASPQQGLSSTDFEDLMSADGFQRNPEAVWSYIKSAEKTYRHCEPNQGHRVLSLLERVLSRAWVATQNVDNLHQRAGSKNVIELHGSIYQLKCTSCCHKQLIADFDEVDHGITCSSCGSAMRPGVVFYGEDLDGDAMKLLEHELADPFDLVFSIGTSSVFPYVTAPFHRATTAGIPTVEINPSRTGISDIVSIQIALGAADALSRVWESFAMHPTMRERMRSAGIQIE